MLCDKFRYIELGRQCEVGEHYGIMRFALLVEDLPIEVTEVTWGKIVCLFVERGMLQAQL